MSDEATADRLAAWHAEVEARLSRLFSEGDVSCSALASRLRDIETELADCRSRFDAELSQKTAACGRLEDRLCDADDALDALRREHSWALAENERLTRRAAELASSIDESRAAMRRQFDEMPFAICRCTGDGALTDANRAFALLIGLQSADQARAVNFCDVFESPADLPWLITRCSSSKAPITIETAWKTKEGSRLAVRLTASAQAPDAIEIVAEDLTNLRSLQERLAPAQRMEAVGRLASEVAVTCANLLSDVHQDVERWLRSAGTDSSLRARGEMLLEEVTRAAGFLRQLAAYGDDQASALSRVDLNKVLRDLAPVLKSVAGDDVELELPKSRTPLTVDVRGDRVERLLVNLAGYGRERMPFGGRLKIELATVTVDQSFIEKYPNVRHGPHALITVTEIRRTARAEGPLRLRELAAPTQSERESAGSPGVDLSALQALIGECTGHLWMTALPHGDMVVQIRLPLCPAGAQKQAAAPAAGAMLGPAGSSMVRH